MDYTDFEEDKIKRRRQFNKKLNVKFLTVKENDGSVRAQFIRTMAALVSKFVTPRQLISTLFVLAAYTVILLVLTILSDLSFIYYEIFYGLSEEVSMKLGVEHDIKLRFFGACFAVLAIMVEIDTAFITNHISILKSFVPRSILLFFVRTLSELNQMITYATK